MKLNKVLALALSGVMAVSMLAGCSGNPGNGGQEGEGEQVPATGVSVNVGNLIKADLDEDVNIDFVTFADDNVLDKALDYTMGKVGVVDTLRGYMAFKTLKELPSTDVVYSTMMEKMDVTDDTWVKGYNGTNTTENSIGYVTAATDGEDATAVRVYAISDAISEEVIEEYVAKDLSDDIVTYRHYDPDGDNWYYDYTVSVSMSSKTVNTSSIVGTGATDPTITFVAVQVVREARTQD